MRREDSRGAARGRFPACACAWRARKPKTAKNVHNAGYNRRGSKDSQLR